MANQFLKLRRSAVPGRVPSTSSIDFGEIALNTYDGLAFIKRSGSMGEEVITLGSREGAFTGSFSGSFIGNGGGLFNIPASGIVGLNLSQIATGSVTASVTTGPASFSVVSGSSTFLYVSSSGNVGIGTSTPSAALQVASDAIINTIRIGTGPGTNNVYIGQNVGGISATGASLMDDNVFIGRNAGFTFTNNSNGNVAIGALSLKGGSNAEYNTAVGFLSLTNFTGQYSTALGYNAGGNLTSGGSNTIVGYNTGLGITTGNSNTIIGAQISGLPTTLSNTVIISDGAGSIRLYSPSSGNVLIGTTTDNTINKLQVAGSTFLSGSVTGSDMLIRGSGNTSGTSALTVLNSDGVNIVTARNDASLIFAGVTANYNSAAGTSFFTAGGRYIRFETGISSGPFGVNLFPSVNYNSTYSTANHLDIYVNFTPTSGDANYNSILLRPTVNQTGTATGTSTGLLISPTLTSFVNFKAIQWTNNASGSASWGLYGAGSAPNYLSGSLGIGTTSPNARLDVNGNAIITGSLTVTDTITAQRLVVQTITSSTDYVSGSTIFGNSLSNTHQFTGSVSITGSLNLKGSPAVTGTGTAGQVAFWSGSSAVSGSNNLFWDNVNGRLGIGTNVPTTKLYIDGTGTLLFLGQGTSGVNAFIEFSGNRGFFGFNNATGIECLTSTTRPIIFGHGSTTTYTERMRLSANNGNLLINSVVDNGTDKLQVSGSSRFNGNVLISGSGATSGTNGLLVQNSSAVSTFIVRNDGRLSNGDSTFYVDRYTAGSTTMVISNSGHNNATGISVSSAVGIRAYSSLGVSTNNALGASIYAAGGNTGAPSNISLGLLSNRALITSTASGMNMHTSSMLQVDSTDQGFLPPRMTAAQKTAIGTPARGLMVYDTDTTTEGLWYYSSGSIQSWTRLLNDTGSQVITGSLTVTDTITAQRLLVQTISSSVLYSSGSNIFGNNLTNVQQFTGSLRVTGSGNHWILGGNVGIGTDIPAAPLDVRTTSGFDSAIFKSQYTALAYIGNDNTWAWFGTGTGGAGSRVSIAAQGVRFNVNGTEYGRFGQSGNLMLQNGGTFTDNNIDRLQVSGSTLIRGVGTSTAASLSVQDSAGINSFRVLDNGRILLGGATSAPFIVSATSSNFGRTGTNVAFYSLTSNQTTNTGIWWFTGDALIHTTGAPVVMNIDTNFTPTSGNAIYSVLRLNPTINQQGGANGTTRGLYIVPTLTSAADFRAIETTNNTGYAIYASGSAQSYFGGPVNIQSALLDYSQSIAIPTGSYQIVASELTSSYRAAFFDYVLFSGSVSRAGTVYTVWSGSTTEYFENYTADIGGSTSLATLQTGISGSSIQLQAGLSGSGWTIRSLVRML